MGVFKKSDCWLCQFTAPEVKILIICCYQITVLALLWTTLTYHTSRNRELAIQIGTYFRCSINGVHDLLDCEQYREEFEDITIQELQVLYLILFAFINLSNLPLIIEYKSVKDMVVSTLNSILGHNTVKEAQLPSHARKESKMTSNAT